MNFTRIFESHYFSFENIYYLLVIYQHDYLEEKMGLLYFKIKFKEMDYKWS